MRTPERTSNGRWFLTIAIVMVISASGCGRSSDMLTSPSERQTLWGLGYSSPDTVLGLLSFLVGVSYHEHTEPYTSADVEAYFADKDGMANVVWAEVNRQQLKPVAQGRYILSNASIPPGTSPDLTWAVQGFNGGTFVKTFPMARRMALTNFEYLDTIRASVGRAISYTGSHGSDSLYVTMQHEPWLSRTHIHSDSTSGVVFIERNISDDGTIELSPADLQSLTPHRVYALRFSHNYNALVPYLDGKVRHRTTFSVWIPFVLVP